MAKFKRNTLVITHTGERYVTNLLPGQLEYFLANMQYNTFIGMDYINGTGHVKHTVLKHGHIASVEDLNAKI